MKLTHIFQLVLWATVTQIACAQEAHFITTNGYDNCIELKNTSTRLVLEPNAGGRVLYYELNGENVLYVDPEQDGFTWQPGGDTLEMCGARFDIGPAIGMPKRVPFLQGKWEAEITGQLSARLTSPIDDRFGIQLIREFTLSPGSSEVTVTQTMVNVSDQEQRYYYWGRTFALGGGIALVPKNEHSRFPKGYVLYGPTKPANVIFYNPDDEPNIDVREGIVEVSNTPSLPKFAFDCTEGWIAYLSENNLLFITRFEIFPERQYADILANPSSIWYYKRMVCEIEPIGPLEIMQPGDSASFTEHWSLHEFQFPVDRRADINAVKKLIN